MTMPAKSSWRSGQAPKDIFDEVSNTMLMRNVNGTVEISIPPDAARVVIIRQPASQGNAAANP